MTTVVARQRVMVPVTIPNGTALSGEVNLGGMELVGVAMPAAWTAASLGLVALGTDGTTFATVVNEANTEFQIVTGAAVANGYIALSLATTGVLRGLGRVKVRSGTAVTPVNQGAARSFYLICLT